MSDGYEAWRSALTASASSGDTARTSKSAILPIALRLPSTTYRGAIADVARSVAAFGNIKPNGREAPAAAPAAEAVLPERRGTRRLPGLLLRGSDSHFTLYARHSGGALTRLPWRIENEREHQRILTAAPTTARPEVSGGHHERHVACECLSRA